MNRLELNLPASDWDVEYSMDHDNESGTSFLSVNAVMKGGASGMSIFVSRNDDEGGVLAPMELLETSMADELERLNAGIPEYYLMFMENPIVPFTFQGRDAAYFVEQKPGESSAVLHAVVMDESSWCSFVTVRVEDWTTIADPSSIFTILEDTLVL